MGPLTRTGAVAEGSIKADVPMGQPSTFGSLGGRVNVRARSGDRRALLLRDQAQLPQTRLVPGRWP
jgi:hypothetical protein